MDNKAVRHFTGQEDDETDKTAYESWYKSETLEYLTFVKIKNNQVLRYIFSLQKPNHQFYKEAIVIKHLSYLTNKPVCFISYLPAITNTDHFIFGIFYKDSLFIIDPNGLPKKLDQSYLILSHLKNDLNLKNIYLSNTKIQRDNVSCGPVCIELMRCFSDLELVKLEELLAKCQQHSIKEDALEFTSVDISFCLPESLANVLKKREQLEYQTTILEIRQSHLTILQDPVIEDLNSVNSIDDYLFDTCENAPEQKFARHFIFNKYPKLKERNLNINWGEKSEYPDSEIILRDIQNNFLTLSEIRDELLASDRYRPLLQIQANSINPTKAKAEFPKSKQAQLTMPARSQNVMDSNSVDNPNDPKKLNFENENQEKKFNDLRLERAKLLIAANAAGDDRNLHEHGNKRDYWYSIGDGYRLVFAIRKNRLEYLDSHQTPYFIKTNGEDYSATRQNQAGIFIADPYYLNNFAESLLDDIKVITGTHEIQARNQLWTEMPTLLIMPLLSGLHWRAIRVQINYSTKKASILWDDPYGGEHFNQKLMDLLLSTLREVIEKLIQVETGEQNFQLLEELEQNKRVINQQGNANNYDCGPIVFSNVNDYTNHNATNQALAQNHGMTIMSYLEWNHKSQVQTIRQNDIASYRRATGLSSSSRLKLDNTEQVCKVKSEKIISKSNNESSILIKISQLKSEQISQLYEYIELNRLENKAATTEYSTQELETAYKVVTGKDENSDIESLTEKANALKISKFHSKNVISIHELRQKIAQLTKATKNISQFPHSEVKILNLQLKEINFYLDNPEYVANAASVGGLYRFRQKHQPQLLKATLLIDNMLDPTKYPNKELINLDESSYKKINKGFTLLAQLFKLKRAYTDMAKGKKFQLAGVKPFDDKHPISQGNPIKELSKQNKRNLIEKLKRQGEKSILRDDEKALFAALLKLPYKLQHATNYYYPALNSGSLDSYTEIQRRNSDYISPFSTKGNIEKLGNGGFVFYRLYVDGVNSSETRYGNTTLATDLKSLLKHGWISLHDQLVPFSTPGATRLYWGKRLLRNAKVVNLSNKKISEKGLYTGLSYEYRSSKIINYGGEKDTQKSFGNTIEAHKRDIKFMEEVFYGEDILLGIALAVIYELRWLEACGFRKHFLDELQRKDETEKIIYLGELLKGLFRIEGKYPVAMRFEHYEGKQPNSIHFKPMASSTESKAKTYRAEVANPEGDGRYNQDLSINETAMELANHKMLLQESKDKISIARRLRKKFADKNEAQFKKWDEKLTRWTKQQEIAKAAIDKSSEFRLEVISELEEHGVEIQLISDKIPTHKLSIINEKFGELIGAEVVSFAELVSMSVERLTIITGEPYYDLLMDEIISFAELADLSKGNLLALAEYNILKPLEEGYSIAELAKLYKKNPIHLTCLTCADLTDLVLEEASDIDPIVRQYAEEQGVDFDWILEQLGETDQVLFRAKLGYDEDPQTEEYDQDYESEEQSEEEENDASDMENILEGAFLDMMEQHLSNYRTLDETEQQKTVGKLITISYEDPYNSVFQNENHIDRIAILRNLYSSYCLDSLSCQKSAGYDAESGESIEHEDYNSFSDDDFSYSPG
jgi:hypothetical protein